MRAWLITLGLCAVSAVASLACAQPDAPRDSAPPAAVLDRLTLGANGSTLSGASGGLGASADWLHYLGSKSMLGVGVEHQAIADARWTFASLSGALTRTSEAGRTISFSGEIHRGSGDDAGRSFSHSITAVGVTGEVTDRLSLRFESREIHIDRADGNLPKLGLSFLWNTRFLTDVAYARSVSGNLGTRLVSTRTDYYGEHFGVLFGGAFGDAAPSVVNLQPGLSAPDGGLRQLFVGISRPLARAELLAVADYLELGGNERVTLTIAFTIPLGREARSSP